MRYWVRIKPGMTHGARKQYAGGDELEVGALELRDFGDKFTDVRPLPDNEQSPAFDLASANAQAVITAVRDGLITVEEALTAEGKRPRPRKSVVEALTTLVPLVGEE